ncbi:MAG: TonB-dependent receptor plug domain-containing protein, partial [Flavobacteriia bacterium]|nr:TonB-dependent receptor plug domain-containing protein [Flavobacteriia bacterium]
MKKGLLIFALFVSTFSAIAQQLKGRVLDVMNQPIENAYVFNTNTNSHTHTDSNGNFILEKTVAGNQLEIGILGFKKATIIITENQLQEGFQITLETNIFQLDELIIGKEKNALKTIARIDLALNPVNNSQEILRKVPGLFIGQHAGGGKAEQIFLRGFDIDHGTDIALSVDGMPINMVSHAHGQGYSDLHFIIPETIQKIDFGKGPYYANQGDFNTAGYVSFDTKNSLPTNTVSVGYGDFNSFRTLGMFNLLDHNSKDDAYVALEYIETDGPFESPQNFNRLNLFAKLNTYLNGSDKLTFTTSHFTSRWDASGQIPQRAVDNGMISRFGAIDDTEGGTTSRSNINVQLQKTLADNSFMKANAFYSNYNFELFSNFTFFLENPVDGDQIKQFEERDIFGMNVQFTDILDNGKTETTINKGIGFRFDNSSANQLASTKNRTEILQNIQLGDIQQTNAYAFYNATFELGKWKIAPAVRFDYFKFLYNDALSTNYETLSNSKAIVNPKLNFFYTPNDNMQWFLKSGIGFHSNDARVVLQQDADKILPRAYGLDFGNIWKPTKNLVINTAAWYLFSEEEFVYVGDAGIVEPSGKSERFGLDVGLRYQLTNNLFFTSDATVTKARSLEEVLGEDFIPLAP